MAHRLPATAIAFHASIKMNKIHLHSNRHKNRNKSKHMDSTKEDMHLLGQLYTWQCTSGKVIATACLKSRMPNVHRFLSKHGVVRSGQKSDFISCLEVDCLSDFDEADAKLIDDADMVHVLGQMRASCHSVTTPIRM